MIKSGPASSPAVVGKFQSLVRNKWFFGLVAAGLVSVAATQPVDQGVPEEQYVRIMAVIDRADALRKAGRTEEAHAKYVEAEKALIYFKSVNPLFFPKTVAYRLKEVTERADYRPPVAPMTNSAAKPSANLEAPAAKSGVKLLEAGAEPRTALRYHVKAGDKQTAIMTMKVKIDMGTMAGPDGKPITMPTIPTISMPMDITVQNVAANGDITYEMVMGEVSIAQDATLPPEAIQGMQKAVSEIKGLTSTGVMSNRGQVKKIDVKAPASADPQARQFMEQIKQGTGDMGVPFPEEAVGAGAKWETKKTTKVQNLLMEQTGSYELVAVDGDKVSTKFTIGVDASSPAAQKSPAMQVAGNSTGTANLDLSKVAAPSTELNMHMEVPVGKDKSQVMKMDINFAIDAH